VNFQETTTRLNWSLRPLAERKIAAEAWCDGTNYAKGVDNYFVYNTYVQQKFALDMPDVPAPDDLTPWIQPAATLVASAWRNLNGKISSIEKFTITVARELREAAKEVV
jgi:hypothetical protein